MSYYSEEIAPFVGMVDEGDIHFPVPRVTKKVNAQDEFAGLPDNAAAEDTRMDKAGAVNKLNKKMNKLGDFSERFWLVACHTHLPEYEKDRGSDSPPRVKFSSLAEASRIAKDMSTRYRNRFYVLETVEVCGEFTLQEYKDKRAAEALDDFLD